MDPLDEIEGRIDALIKQLTEKKAEIAGFRKQKSENKLSDSKKKELTVKFGEDVNKAEKEFNDLMKGIEEQFPVESDSESDSDSSSDAAPSSPRPNAVIDLDEENEEEVAEDLLEGLAVNKDQMEQELDKVLKMMKEIEVSPPGSIENMTSSVDSFASQKDKDDFGKAPGDRRARMFRNREMSFNSAFMELSDVAKYEEEEANDLLASEGTGLTISDFTSNMSTSLSSITDSDDPGSESRYSMNSSQSPPPTREEVHKRLRSKAETFSQLINLVQLKEALAKGTLNFDDGEDEDSLADLKIKAKDIIISNPLAQETIRKLSLSRGRTVAQSRSSENFQALKAATPKAPQLILNIVINDSNGKTIAKNKIKISGEAKVIKVKEKILMKIDVNALTSSSGSMGVFLAEYGIFLNNKRTLRSYDLKDEDKLILRKKPTQGLDYVSVHFPASPEIKLRNQQLKCQPDVTTLMGLIKAVDKYYSDATPFPYEKYGLYSLKDMKWLPINIKKPLSYWKLKNQDILEFREMTPQIMNEVKKEEQRILESEQMSVSVLVEITKFLERTSVTMQFDETIQDVLKRVVDDIRRKNPEVSNDYTQYGFFTLTSNELLEESRTVRTSMELLKMAVVLKQKSKEDIKRDKKKKLIALKEERKRQKDGGKKEKRKSSDVKKKKRRSVKSMKPEKTTTDRVDVPKRNNMSQSALSVAVKSVRAIHENNN